MKLNISILIAILITLCVSECLGSSPMIKVILKGNVHEGRVSAYDHDFLPEVYFEPAENVNIYVFFNRNEGLPSASTAEPFTTDKNGAFEATVYYPVSETTVRDCKDANNEKYIFEVKDNTCIEIPHQVEIVVRYPQYNGDKIKYMATRYIFNTANLNITNDKDKNLIIEIKGMLV